MLCNEFAIQCNVDVVVTTKVPQTRVCGTFCLDLRWHMHNEGNSQNCPDIFLMKNYFLTSRKTLMP